MEVFKKTHDLQLFLASKRPTSKVGFVPTMGALHKGHLSLLQKARAENDYVVCSIFVNPTQFNNPEDLKNYPRTLEDDIKLLEGEQKVVLFAPEVSEIYPSGMEERVDVDFGSLDKYMEGAHRPGHFEGVATVVKRLFDIIKPDRAYFGEKDFQQLAIIRHMVKNLGIPVEIVSVPTARESDGLAMSSRNRNLTPEFRAEAANIPRIMEGAKELAPKRNVGEVKEWARQELEKTALRMEYFEIVDPDTLLPLKYWNSEGNNVACIAVFAGKVRLIDNIVF